jgi:hypothetical protein
LQFSSPFLPLLYSPSLTIDELIVAFDQLELFGMEIHIVASIPMDSPVVAYFARFPCSLSPSEP